MFNGVEAPLRNDMRLAWTWLSAKVCLLPVASLVESLGLRMVSWFRLGLVDFGLGGDHGAVLCLVAGTGFALMRAATNISFA